jgi:hypothetical protein
VSIALPLIDGTLPDGTYTSADGHVITVEALS